MNSNNIDTKTNHARAAETLTDRALQRFPIRLLAEKTGIGTSTLRAWERRYGLLKPERTPKGHRLYGEKDVIRINKILRLLDDGHSLPKIAEMMPSLDKGVELASEIETGAAASDDNSLSDTWSHFINKTLEATSDFNIERVDAVYNEASSLYPVDMVTDRLIQPTIEILGKSWKIHPDRGIAEEHFYTSWLKNRLGARFHHAYNQARGSRIICACVPGSFHEIGLMLFALSALARGYRVLYFGADLPLSQIPYIAQRSAAKAIVLGGQTELDPSVNTELPVLVEQLDTPVFIGGHDALIDTSKFEEAGGILLGNNVAVALKVFESHVPVYASTKQPT